MNYADISRYNSRIIVFALILISGFLYLFFPTSVYVSDSLFYARAIEDLPVKSFWLTNPHHLMYALTAVPLFILARLLNPGVRAVYLLQFMNAIAGVFGIIVFYNLIRKVLNNRQFALAGALILGLSYGWWHFAVSAEPYAIINLLYSILFASFYNLFLNTNFKNLIKSLLILSVAVLYHQVAVLLLLPLGVLLYNQPLPKKQRLAYCLFAFLFTGLITGLCYLITAVFILRFNTLQDIFAWLLGYGKNFFSYKFNMEYLAHIFYGQFRAFWGGDFIKRLFLNGPSPALIFTAFIFLAGNISVLAGIINIIKSRKLLEGLRKVALLIFSWVGVNVLFSLFYEPSNFKFYTVNIVPLIFIFLACMDNLPGKFRSGVILWMIVAAFFIVNFFGSVSFQKSPQNSDDYAYARFVHDKTDKGDLVLFPGVESNAHLYLDYFYQGDRDLRLMRYALRNPVKLSADIKKHLSAGRKVYFIPETKIISTGFFFKGYLKISDKFGLSSPDINDFLSKNNFAFIPHERYCGGAGAYKGNSIYILKENR